MSTLDSDEKAEIVRDMIHHEVLPLRSTLDSDEKAEIVRGMIHHGDLLANQRLTWTWMLHGLLFTAASGFWQQSSEIVFALALFGIASCVSIGYQLRRGMAASDHLLVDISSKFIPAIPVVATENRARLRWLLPGCFFPCALGLVWTVILLALAIRLGRPGR